MLAVNDDRIAGAVSRLGSESAFEVLARARALEAQGRRIVHMEIDTPEHIKEACFKSLRDNHTHYTGSAGIPELRAVVAEYASTFRKMPKAYTAENVVVAPGAKPIIWNTLSAILNPGDHFVYFDPAYPAYASAASYLQADVTAIPINEYNTIATGSPK